MPDVAENAKKFYAQVAVPADSFARAVAFAISQPAEVDINEILYRPTRQEYRCHRLGCQLKPRRGGIG